MDLSYVDTNRVHSLVFWRLKMRIIYKQSSGICGVLIFAPNFLATLSMVQKKKN